MFVNTKSSPQNQTRIQTESQAATAQQAAATALRKHRDADDPTLLHDFMGSRKAAK